jgi:hypothetical protein
MENNFGCRAYYALIVILPVERILERVQERGPLLATAA